MPHEYDALDLQLGFNLNSAASATSSGPSLKALPSVTDSGVRVCVCVCVCARARVQCAERESVCVCVCVRKNALMVQLLSEHALLEAGPHVLARLLISSQLLKNVRMYLRIHRRVLARLLVLCLSPVDVA